MSVQTQLYLQSFLLTSNDCAYHSCTLLILGISFKPSGRSASSSTRCANRIGSSSERNCDARNNVPTALLVSHNLPCSMSENMLTYPLKDCCRIAPCDAHRQYEKHPQPDIGAGNSISLARRIVHLSERHTRSREVRIVLDHVGQLSCRFPGHFAGEKGAQGPKALA